MRLFIGITFQEEVNREIRSFSDKLKEQSLKGKFTSEGNIHLTLVFLGETEEDKLPEIDACLKSIFVEPFAIKIGGLGMFEKKGGDIYWMAVKRSRELSELQKKLEQELTSRGFKLENKPFVPHLTLGRNISMGESFELSKAAEEAPVIDIMVDGINLMLSHRVEERLVYTPILVQAFTNNLCSD